MKLKKFAAMMLAGVMAVSMLAGCSGKGTNGGNNGGNTVVEPSTSSIVAALNNGQNEKNKVKVNFSSDASLDAALQKAVAEAGDYNHGVGIISDIRNLLGKTYDAWGDLATKDTPDTEIKDKQSVTVFALYPVMTSMDYWTEADVINYVARHMDEEIAKGFNVTENNNPNTYVLPENNMNAPLEDDTEDEDTPGKNYFSFSYTGTASMVSAVEEGGNTVYYVAFTITQTAAKQTVKA